MDPGVRGERCQEALGFSYSNSIMVGVQVVESEKEKALAGVK